MTSRSRRYTENIWSSAPEGVVNFLKEPFIERGNFYFPLLSEILHGKVFLLNGGDTRNFCAIVKVLILVKCFEE
jgi:hypothetical protein